MFLKSRPIVDDGLSDEEPDASYTDLCCDGPLFGLTQGRLHYCTDEERRKNTRKAVYDEIDALVKWRLTNASPISTDEEEKERLWGRGECQAPPTHTTKCLLEDGLSEDEDEDMKDNESDESIPYKESKQKSVKSISRKRLKLTTNRHKTTVDRTGSETENSPSKSGHHEKHDQLASSASGLKSIHHIFYIPQDVEPLTASISSPVGDNFAKNGSWSKRTVVFPLDSGYECSVSEVPVRSEQVGSVAPALKFDSMFESGNLQKAIRVGEFSYELILQPDINTQRHTQWYYFQIANALPDITYHFTITNLRKKDSLYNHGLRPLFYSTVDASEKGIGWVRTGHSIRYSKNYNRQIDGLVADMAYYQLSWQMEFPHANDITYLAHCYPYTYTDLQKYIMSIQSDSAKSEYCRRDMLCHTLADRECYILTITDFSCK
jgi:hypothetical protein